MIKEAILVTVAAASLHLGTIHESQGSVSRIFWMRNNGDDTVRIIQTYPSCGCTTISFLPPGSIPPGDSLAVSVGFNPANRGGDFYETATILMTSENDTVRKVLSIEGTVVTSEETLIRQYPVHKGSIRLTADTLNMGEVRRGESKTMYVGVLPEMDYGKRRSIPVTFTAGEHIGWGAQNIGIDLPIDSLGVRKERVNISVVIMPRLTDSTCSDKGSQPHIIAERRIAPTATSLPITNTGNAHLIIYRAYTDQGRDIIDKETSIAPQQTLRMDLPRWNKGENRITLICNDSRRQRFIVRIDRR